MKLDNKVVLITGAGGGIGQAAVRKFVSEGAKVMLADIGTDVTQTLVDELGSEHCACVAVDVAMADQVEAADRPAPQAIIPGGEGGGPVSRRRFLPRAGAR